MVKNYLYFGIVFLFIFFTFLVWGDSNGIFYDVSDVRPGILGFDEQENVLNFTFSVPLKIENNLSVNSNILIKSNSLEANRVATKIYVDNLRDNMNACFSEGLLFNGSSCICPSGVDC